MNEQKALAILCKAYLKAIGAKNYDLRSFEYQDKKETFLKLDPFFIALKSIVLDTEELACLEFLRSLDKKSIPEGLEFTVELLKKHGGARVGSGNFSPYKEETKVVNFRCPVSKENEFREYCNAKLEEYKK